MPDTTTEKKLLDLARRAVVAAKQVFNLQDGLSKVSPNVARSARIDVREAIDMLQELEKLLSYRANEE